MIHTDQVWFQQVIYVSCMSDMTLTGIYYSDMSYMITTGQIWFQYVIFDSKSQILVLQYQETSVVCRLMRCGGESLLAEVLGILLAFILENENDGQLWRITKSRSRFRLSIQIKTFTPGIHKSLNATDKRIQIKHDTSRHDTYIRQIGRKNRNKIIATNL